MPPGDVNQLTINAGMFDLTTKEDCFNCSACAMGRFSRPLEHHAPYSPVIVATGADLRLAVISDSHGRLIAPPNSSFPQ
ncbi:TPA: hypothetical protein HMM56_14295 [Escherichia coli]|nr:hypothetical protein [Escherichia coli]HAJ2042713.1 hypothetical protein [Escherichia coli]HAJ2072607.1 hypothetical protein [Escherichia coli]HAJ2147503.1 hypothetical protein [Escherichia coli]HAJ2192976.1 hypothetical protein [Escherichia coli]